VSGRPALVTLLAGLAAVTLLVSAAPVAAATMCHTAGAASTRLAELTARASARMLEASSQALLALKALEEQGEAFGEHRRRATALLDEALGDYRQALALPDDLARGDAFLKARPFERLRLTLGITPGTLNAVRWEAIARTARQSRTPTADLLGVCVAGAESLKATLAGLGPTTAPSMVRRAGYAWMLVLTHGGLVSDALDDTVR